MLRLPPRRGRTSPTVSTISAASRFSEVKKQRVLRLSSFFYFCFNSPPSLYIQGVFRNNVALRFASLTAAARSDESYCLYHFGGLGLVAKINATEKFPSRFYFCCLSRRFYRACRVFTRHEVPRQSPQTKYVILSAAKYPTELSTSLIYCLCVNVKRANLLARVCER